MKAERPKYPTKAEVKDVNDRIYIYRERLEKYIYQLESQITELQNENKGLKVQMKALQDAVNELQSQLKKERELKLNTDDPYNHVLTNLKGDTFTFNPQSGFGEELNDFLHGYFNLKP